MAHEGAGHLDDPDRRVVARLSDQPVREPRQRRPRCWQPRRCDSGPASPSASSPSTRAAAITSVGHLTHRPPGGSTTDAATHDRRHRDEQHAGGDGENRACSGRRCRRQPLERVGRGRARTAASRATAIAALAQCFVEIDHRYSLPRSSRSCLPRVGQGGLDRSFGAAEHHGDLGDGQAEEVVQLDHGPPTSGQPRDGAVEVDVALARVRLPSRRVRASASCRRCRLRAASVVRVSSQVSAVPRAGSNRSRLRHARTSASCSTSSHSAPP